MGSIYIDGVLENTHSVNYGITATDRYSLGQEYDNLNTSQFYNGRIDDLRIWSTVRTLSEIQANMNMELTGSESGLIAYYDFNQGSPGLNNAGLTTLYDLTSANLDGELNNFTLDSTGSNWVRADCSNSII